MNSTTSTSGWLGERLAAGLGELTLEKVADVGLANARANLSFTSNGKSILALRQTTLMAGSDAIVIAAGPSLHRHDVAAKLRKSGFKGVVIATESAMAYCLRNGIKPDLVVTVDPHADRIVRWFGDPELDEARLARDDYFGRQDIDPTFRKNEAAFNRSVIELIDEHGRGIRVAISSSASAAVARRVAQIGMDAYWWNPMYDDYDREGSLTRDIHMLNSLPCVNAGGNVGAACWVFAHAVLRKRRVALVGMDFGYYPDTTYAQTQYYRELLALVGSDRLDEVFVRIHNPHVGVEFFTDPAYLWYRNVFLEMARDADCVTYNCTGGGILFGDPIRWSSLDTFLAESRG